MFKKGVESPWPSPQGEAKPAQPGGSPSLGAPGRGHRCRRRPPPRPQPASATLAPSGGPAPSAMSAPNASAPTGPREYRAQGRRPVAAPRQAGHSPQPRAPGPGSGGPGRRRSPSGPLRGGRDAAAGRAPPGSPRRACGRAPPSPSRPARPAVRRSLSVWNGTCVSPRKPYTPTSSEGAWNHRRAALSPSPAFGLLHSKTKVYLCR